MANITINDTHPAHGENLLTKVSHFLGAFFSGGRDRKLADLSEMNTHTLSDIGIRREQIPPNFSRFSDDDQRLYWTS